MKKLELQAIYAAIQNLENEFLTENKHLLDLIEKMFLEYKNTTDAAKNAENLYFKAYDGLKANYKTFKEFIANKQKNENLQVLEANYINLNKKVDLLADANTVIHEGFRTALYNYLDRFLINILSKAKNQRDFNDILRYFEYDYSSREYKNNFIIRVYYSVYSGYLEATYIKTGAKTTLYHNAFKYIDFQNYKVDFDDLQKIESAPKKVDFVKYLNDDKLTLNKLLNSVESLNKFKHAQEAALKEFMQKQEAALKQKDIYDLLSIYNKK